MQHQPVVEDVEVLDVTVGVLVEGEEAVEVVGEDVVVEEAGENLMIKRQVHEAIFDTFTMILVLL